MFLSLGNRAMILHWKSLVLRALTRFLLFGKIISRRLLFLFYLMQALERFLPFVTPLRARSILKSVRLRLIRILVREFRVVITDTITRALLITHLTLLLVQMILLSVGKILIRPF